MVLVGPRRPVERLLSWLRRGGRGRRRVWWWRGRRRCWRRRGLGRRGDVVSSAAPETGEGAEPGPFVVRGVQRFGGPWCSLVGSCERVAGPVELCASGRGSAATMAACWSRSVRSWRSRGRGRRGRRGSWVRRGACASATASPGVRWSARRSGGVVGVGAGVPGVGGLLASALADVAGVAVEGGGAEEVDLVPGAALGAVDGACPAHGRRWACRRVGCRRSIAAGRKTWPPSSRSTVAPSVVDGSDGAGGAVEHARSGRGSRLVCTRMRSPAA